MSLSENQKSLLDQGYSIMLWPPSTSPIRQGQTIVVSGLTLEVLAAEDASNTVGEFRRITVRKHG